jgi:hypothetical protein
MADASHSKCDEETREGSNPSPGTKGPDSPEYSEKPTDVHGFLFSYLRHIRSTQPVRGNFVNILELRTSAETPVTQRESGPSRDPGRPHVTGDNCDSTSEQLFDLEFEAPVAAACSNFF